MARYGREYRQGGPGRHPYWRGAEGIYGPDYRREPSRPYPHPSESDFAAERYDLEYSGRGWGYGVGYEDGMREDVADRGGYGEGDRDVQRSPHAPGGRLPEGSSRGASGGRHLDDDDVREDVREALFQDSWIEPDRIEVEVENGVVTMKGEVRDFMEARYAWDDVWETPGVRGVINQLTIRPDDVEEDEPRPQTAGDDESAASKKQKKR